METKKVPLNDIYKVLAMRYILSKGEYASYDVRRGLEGKLVHVTRKDVREGISADKLRAEFNFTDVEQMINDLFTYAYAVYSRNNKSDAFAWSELERLAHDEAEKASKNIQKDTNNEH